MESRSDDDRPWQTYHTVFTNAKAGMDGVDKEKVQKIVYEMSKGSKFFENEQRKEAYIKQKIGSLRAQCASLTQKDISHFQKIADRRILELEASRDLSQMWLHVDMDAFFAAVETLGNPHLKGKPLAVGNMSMICTASYEARKFGVRAAMPGFIARKLCPELIFVSTDFEKYTYYSKLTRKVYQKYDPFFIATSLDEAYLNVTEVCSKRGVNVDEIAAELRGVIYEETGLTCSAGVAPNRLLAKIVPKNTVLHLHSLEKGLDGLPIITWMTHIRTFLANTKHSILFSVVCSDINKPNGQYILPNDRMAVMTFISSLPIRKIGGVGKVTEHILKEVFGIYHCEHMLQKSPLLCALFSPSSADFFLSVGLGLGGTNAPQCKSRKSMSNERTFSSTDNEQLLFQKLEEIAESLSSDMHKESLSGRTLTLKLKTAAFEVRTRALTMPKYIHSKEDILINAIRLLKAELPLSLRLIGLRMSHFKDDDDASLDTAQRTLKNYFISGDASMSISCNEHSSRSDIHDDKLMYDLEHDEICFSNTMFGSSRPCDSIGPREPGNTYKALLLNSCTNSGGSHTNRSNEGPPEVKNLEKVSKSLLSDTSLSPHNLNADKEQLVWIDDYICSICGAELPASFIDERQEHNDYHIAKVLQEGENKRSSRENLASERPTQRERRAEVNSHKKRKSSQRDHKYLPIDSFFVKTAQNY